MVERETAILEPGEPISTKEIAATGVKLEVTLVETTLAKAGVERTFSKAYAASETTVHFKPVTAVACIHC